MFCMSTILLHLIPASLYAGLGVVFWRSCILARAPLAKGRQCMAPRERVFLLIALVAHGVALHSAIFPGEEMRFGFGVAMSLMVWLAICFYWVETSTPGSMALCRGDAAGVLAFPCSFLRTRPANAYRRRFCALRHRHAGLQPDAGGPARAIDVGRRASANARRPPAHQLAATDDDGGAALRLIAIAFSL